MENKKINIAEILKNCPPGMELNCTAYNNLYFDNIIDSLSSHPIKCYTTNNGMLTSVFFSKYGGIGNEESAKCVIFPKGKTTWKGFQGYFKDGDIVATRTKRYIWISIYKENRNGRVQTHADYNKKTSDFFIDFNGGNLYLCDEDEIICQRFATEEEKQKLFNKIKEHGYHWNAETKTLEKLIKPKFKVGDRIKKKGNYIPGIITAISEDNFYKVEYNKGSVTYVNVKFQDNYELVLDKIEPKFKVGDRIKHKVTGSIYTIIFVRSNEYDVAVTNEIGKSISIKEQDNYELMSDKFDISTLVPFESRVLVRDNEDEIWKPAIFGEYLDDHNDIYRYVIIGGHFYQYLIPYEGNEHLRCKQDDCKEFYKTWEL